MQLELEPELESEFEIELEPELESKFEPELELELLVEAIPLNQP